MAYQSFKKRDKSIEDDLLKQLAMMDYEEDLSDTTSQYSEYGKDILKQLEIDENKTPIETDYNPELELNNLHNKIQTKFQKKIMVSRQITNYVNRKNNKFLKKKMKEENPNEADNMTDYASVTDQQTLAPSRMMQGSVFSDFGDEFKDELRNLKGLNNHILGKNQIEEMKLKVRQEMDVMKKNKPEMWDLGQLDVQDQSKALEMTQKSALEQKEIGFGTEFDRDVDEIKRSLDKDLEQKLAEIRENQLSLELQRERNKMAEEVRKHPNMIIQ